MNLACRPKVPKHAVRAQGQAAGCLLLTSAISACLVTDKIEPNEQNFPPYVSVEAPQVVSQVPAFPNCPGVSPPPIVDGEELPFRGPWMRFVVHVSDPNIDDALTGRVIVNRANGPNPASAPIPVTGTQDRRPIEFCLDASYLGRACNHVEFLVSNRFSDGQGFPYAPEQEGDVGRVEWIVRGISRDSPASSEDDCLDLFDGGVP